jgi:hypothetical protein
MKIIKLINSPKKNKRYRVYLDNGEHYDFGLDTGSTYIDHRDKQKRENYRARHMGNLSEKYLIENLIPSPALFSYWLLWGDSVLLEQNLKNLNKMFKKIL